MKNNFFQIKRYIETTSPSIDWSITGDTYPPSPRGLFIANVTQGLFFVGIAFLFLGESLFKNIGIHEPKWFVEMKNNKMAVFAVLFILNNIGTSQLSSGAFEIYRNNQLVFSKLQTGRFPNQQDIMRIIGN